MAINSKFLADMKVRTAEVITTINLYELSNHRLSFCYPTYVRLMIAKYGAEHIFQVTENYHGHYNDDTCNFIYWNEITGEFFKDSWSTAYAAPPFSSFQWTDLMVGFENDAIDKNKIFIAVKNENQDNFNNPHISYELKNILNSHPKVTVSKGRKWKGTGYLIDIVSKTFQWDTPRWTSRYYGDNGYGRTTTTYAKIYDPKTNKIELVNINYVVVDDIDKMISEYKALKKKIFDNLTIDNLIFEKGKFPRFDIEKIASFETWINENYTNSIDLSSAIDADEEKQKAKQKAKNDKFKEKKMEQLVEWVKTHTDKKDDEIIQLAEKIFNKKYRNND